MISQGLQLFCNGIQSLFSNFTNFSGIWNLDSVGPSTLPDEKNPFYKKKQTKQPILPIHHSQTNHPLGLPANYTETLGDNVLHAWDDILSV